MVSYPSVHAIKHSLLQGIFPTQGSNPGLPTLQVDSLPAELQGKPKNTGVGSLSLLQQISPVQELNRGLLHCGQILFQLSSQGIRPPVQAGSLVWEDPVCCGAAKPMRHKCGASALEPALCNKRSHQNGKLVYCNKDPEKPKTIKKKKKKVYALISFDIYVHAGNHLQSRGRRYPSPSKLAPCPFPVPPVTQEPPICFLSPHISGHLRHFFLCK